LSSKRLGLSEDCNVISADFHSLAAAPRDEIRFERSMGTAQTVEKAGGTAGVGGFDFGMKAAA